jgi:TonB family protein
MVKGMVTREVVVHVRVVVDAAGRVTAAEPVPGKGAVSGFLGNSAATAAKLWRFDPARADGKPVPSEVVLVFRFAPSK